MVDLLLDYIDTLVSKSLVYERTGPLLHIEAYVFTGLSIYDLYVRRCMSNKY